MSKTAIKHIEDQLQATGLSGYKGEAQVYPLGKDQIDKAPAVFVGGSDWRFVHDLDLQSGVVYFRLIDTTEDIDILLPDSWLNVNLRFVVVAIQRRKDFDSCETSVPLELGKILNSSLVGGFKITGANNGRIARTRATFDLSEIDREEFSGSLKFDSSLVGVRGEYELTYRTKESCVNKSLC